MAKVYLLLLQLLQVAFLWIHDWLPLGALNDVRAVREQDSLRRLLIITIVQSLSFTLLLALCVIYFQSAYPLWLVRSLWIAYSLLLIGQLRAWWLPYLFRAEPDRAARYRKMFGKTHAFLHERSGLVPNTAHTLLHICTAATLLALLAM
ncbi:hypothetical protein Jab_2c07440 [Janthinobacterium sp. HH01]|uniref:hypothetical protein n=1 Tax=Janthinobacterium sp. HH01 TaxID=1198452 RepID=UPI0002AEB81F|nr:hypothetical protein [Janthinobacterium sp. HH01]ELX08689.1 hypothetical protein Jab_2c07440 [Janthinobacterium sp. HH01]